MFHRPFPRLVSHAGGWNARRIPCASLLFSAAAMLVFFLPNLAASLQYERSAIGDGQVWRLISGHFVHYSSDHLFWDVVAFVLLGGVSELRSRSRFLVCAMVSAVAISLVVWFCLPDMSTYGGLSGIDSALFALLVVQLSRDAVRANERGQGAMAVALLAAFLLKVSFELITQENVFVQALGSGTVGVPLAHITGAVVGGLIGLARSRNCAWNSVNQRFCRGRRASPVVAAELLPS